MTMEADEIRVSESVPVGAGQRRGTRAMAPGDIPAVGRLFNRIFRRQDHAPENDLDVISRPSSSAAPTILPNSAASCTKTVRPA